MTEDGNADELLALKHPETKSCGGVCCGVVMVGYKRFGHGVTAKLGHVVTVWLDQFPGWAVAVALVAPPLAGLSVSRHLEVRC
jgi:hypothetical protein